MAAGRKWQKVATARAFTRDGRIAESGTHAELSRKGGEYGALFETQAQWCR